MQKTILSTLAALFLAGTLAMPAFAMGDGSVRFDHRSGGDPSTSVMSDLNPQPLPPGRHGLTFSVCRSAASYEPPDPCLS